MADARPPDDVVADIIAVPTDAAARAVEAAALEATDNAPSPDDGPQPEQHDGH